MAFEKYFVVGFLPFYWRISYSQTGPSNYF